MNAEQQEAQRIRIFDGCVAQGHMKECAERAADNPEATEGPMCGCKGGILAVVRKTKASVEK